MWNSYAKLDRLKKALKSRNIDPEKMSITQLMNVLEKRGMTDSRMSSFVWELISFLEPPGCTMSHCEHYGHSTAPCNCSLARVPGRCKEHRDYLKRCEERAKKVRCVNDEEYASYLNLFRLSEGKYVYPTDDEVAVIAIPREQLMVINKGHNLSDFGILPQEETTE